MPQYLLSLVSTQAESGGSSTNYTIKYAKPLVFDEGEWEVGLISATIPHTYFNISAAQGNNKLHYYNGTSNQSMTIPDGMYSVAALNTYIQATLGNTNIAFSADATRLRVKLRLANNYEVDFTGTDTFRDILGFDAVVLDTQATDLYAPNRANITNSNDSFYIACDLASGSYSRIGGNQSNILFGFNFTSPQGSNETFVPAEHVHLPVAKSYCDSINIRILNQDGRQVDLNGETVAVNIKVKKILPINAMTF